MSIVKVIEIISEGKTLEEAINAGVVEAAKTVKHIKQINVDYIEGIVEKNRISKFRVNSKISFLVDHKL